MSSAHLGEYIDTRNYRGYGEANMNKLTRRKQEMVLSMLVKGLSVRDTARLSGASLNSVLRFIERAGKMCARYHNAKVRRVGAPRLQCDEMWSFVYSKKKNVSAAKAAPPEAGDAWIWIGMGEASKLVISYMDSPTRAPEYATRFMKDLRSRASNERVHITTDGLRSYITAISEAFGDNVDYAQLVKHYNMKQRPQREEETRYSPRDVEFATKTPVFGQPDRDLVNTSYVERYNRTMRMSMRRFTRLTDGFSKKLDNHRHMLAIHTVHYNFVRRHMTLKTTPAVASGLDDTVHSIGWMLDMIDGNVPFKKIVPRKVIRAVKAMVG